MDPTRVPAAGVRVRCPSCGHVFRVRMRPQPVEPVLSQVAAPAPAPATAAPPVAEATSAVAAPDVLPDFQRESASLFGTQKVVPAVPETPEPVKAPPSKPAPSVSWSSGERTIDFDAPVNPPADKPKPRTTLETAPFRPGGTAPGSASPVPETPAPTAPPFQSQAPFRPQPTAPVPPQPAAPVAPKPQQTLHTQAPPVVPSVSVPTQDSAMPRDHQRARRLARVLVSDIMVYNQESRDKALAEGNLVSMLAGEVNKAWELYKSKVDAVVLEGSDYFKDALNEILADGRKVY
jgi:hypothetical protein